MRLYVSGGMTGWKDHNEVAFEQAKVLLESMGHDVTTPTELDKAAGVSLEGDGFQHDDTAYEGFLARDLDFIHRDRFDGVVFIRGWLTSGGAGREGRKAIEEGLGLFILRPTDSDQDGLVELHPISSTYFLRWSTTARKRPGEVLA